MEDCPQKMKWGGFNLTYMKTRNDKHIEETLVIRVGVSERQLKHHNPEKKLCNLTLIIKKMKIHDF